MSNILNKVLDDITMQRILDMAKAMANTAHDKKDLIASSVISFVVGGITYYIYLRRSQSKSKMAAMVEVPENTINRSNRPAPLVQPGIDPVTGLPEITPPDKIVHQAPDRYGSAAPGPHGMEVHEEVARQQARDAEEADARRAGREGRDESVMKSKLRVQDLSMGMADRDTSQGEVVTAVQGADGMGGGFGSGVGGGYGLDDGNDTPSTEDAGPQEGDEGGNAGDATDDDSWNEEIWGPHYLRFSPQ